MVFIDKLIERVIETRNPSVIGLDTRIEYVPDGIRADCRDEFGEGAQADAEAIYRFNRKLIEHVKDIVPAVKPQIACYEMYGAYGADALIRTARFAADNGLLVIADGKRNDIGATAEAYAAAHLGDKPGAYFADALTVNPYLGIDGVQPFLNQCRDRGKGVFVLVKTSNASSGQFQDLQLTNGKKAYEHIADLVQEWAGGEGLMGTYGYSSVGAVVGATYPGQAKALRARVNKVYFLVPGFGAQGGDAEGAAAAFDAAGLGAVVNASRSVLCAWSHARWGGKYSHADFAEAARAEALRMKTELNRAIGATD